ncbi:hypothetical protein CUC15_11835 [Oceanobacillus zhaokaii]|jgi:hypothetical protein|uniref:Post-transcriptional regulator n=1 Tax=Oceanobacillus zhaokaii TaxID=2052660 RepID=A0A345PHU1_9BACI|nr:post-transcriptional regulator [Oceanobacillus zhaokaii]AXI09571.1 hypothetical protein CUC15_11835 [Oceanobacillus zhaokaii]
MTIIQQCNEWKTMVEPVLVSKAAELRLMGYSQATAGDVWTCLVEKVWKGNPEKRIHEIVQDIFHLGSGIYLSYLTIQSYQNDDLMASIAALTGSSEA